jgi:hypothetical protein
MIHYDLRQALFNQDQRTEQHERQHYKKYIVSSFHKATLI